MYMKNILKITIACLVLSASHVYSQETQEMQETKETKKSSETIDLGFGVSQDKKTSTASTATVKSDALKERAAINLNDALYGRLLGLTALMSSGNGWVGDPGYGASYNIRGVQTWTEDWSKFLILVDGFPRSIDRLSLDEVESVTVLKDAAAIALYGYTGVNGIINVKTRRAETNGMKINVNYHHKFTFLPQMPEFADANTYAQAMNEARRNDGLAQAYTQFELDAFKSGAFSKVYPNVDWKKEALRNFASEDVLNMNFSNRNEKVGFFTMLNYTNSQGMFKGTGVNKDDGGYSTQLQYSKANVRTNLDVVLTSSTKFEANILGSLFETNRPSGTNASWMFSTLNFLPSSAFPVRTQDGLWGGSYTFNNVSIYNPVARIQNSGYYREIGVVLNADFKLTQSLDEVIKGLSLTGRFGYDAYNIAYENRNKLYSWANERFTFDAEGNPIVGGNIREQDYQTNNQLNFDKGNVSTSRSLNFVASADYQTKIDNNNLTASLIYHFSNPVNKNRYNTFYRVNMMGYVHYDYSNKYVADLVLTYDGSNRSYPQSWVFSPTVSLGWVISEEGCLKGSEVVNLLKLRGSFGKLHSDYVPPNPNTGVYGSIYMNMYDWYGSYFNLTNTAGGLGGTGGRLQTVLPTTKFKLETANKYNLGIDARLLNSIDLTLEAYYQRRNNILMSERGLYSIMAGIGAGFGNRGVIDSKGFEIGLNYNKKIGDLQVNAGGMFTYGVNKVIDLVETPVPYPWLSNIGYAVDQPRGMEAIGFFSDAKDVANSPKQEFSLTKPGDIKYKRQNKDEGDQSVNAYDQVPIGYSTNVPRVNYAFNGGLEYKGIGVNVLFQGVGQFNRWDDQLWGGPTGLLPLIQGKNIPVEYYENRWVPGLDNTNAKYPALTTNNNDNNQRGSTLWLRDAAFLKLRNAEVYYKFPEAMLKKINVSGLKLSITGENLYTWTPYNGIDPERTLYTYPTLRGVSAGLSATF